MAKFSMKDKLRAVKLYLESNEGYKAIANEIGVHKSNLQYWVKKYQYHGEKAFSTSYTNYPVRYKLDVLSYMKEHETSIFETAAIFNLPSDKTLWTWRHLLETQGLDALKSTQKLFITVKEKEKNLLFFYLIMFSFF